MQVYSTLDADTITVYSSDHANASADSWPEELFHKARLPVKPGLFQPDLLT